MFVGRQRELAQLEQLYATKRFQLVVVYGRRRIGKTTLISKFCENRRTLYFTALDQADKDNLADFSRAVYSFFDFPTTTGSFATWTDAFEFIAERGKRERFVFAFDELPYAAQRNESIPSALQVTIDHVFKQTEVFMMLCGSNEGFMESDVLGRKSPLYGRRTAQMKIGPLGYLEAAQMFPGLSPQEQFEYYGCFGGVPYYLEQVDSSRSFRDNLASLYFNPSGFLFDEPYGLLRQEFSEPALYASLLRAIAGGANRTKLMADKVGVDATTIPKYLSSLCQLGIIEKVTPFGENERLSRRGIYRICDACYDFWFRFVMPRISDIEGGFGDALVHRLPEQQLDDYLGHRFEQLCLEWLGEQARAGQLPIAVTRLGSWWGTNPVTRSQDDIDVIAADPMEHKMLIGECKFREKFDETAELTDLDAKRDLVKGYATEGIMLFTKKSVSPGTIRKCERRKDVLLVTLDQMYAK